MSRHVFNNDNDFANMPVHLAYPEAKLHYICHIFGFKWGPQMSNWGHSTLSYTGRWILQRVSSSFYSSCWLSWMLRHLQQLKPGCFHLQLHKVITKNREYPRFNSLLFDHCTYNMGMGLQDFWKRCLLLGSFASVATVRGVSAQVAGTPLVQIWVASHGNPMLSDRITSL